MTTTTPVPAILVEYRSRKTETWSACIRGGLFELTSPSGQVGARVTTADAGSRIKVPNFGGRSKHISVVANNGETIHFKAKRPLSKLARRFVLCAELVTGSSSPSRKTMTGISFLALGAAAFVFVGMIVMHNLQQGPKSASGFGGGFAYLTIGALAATFTGIRALLNARQMSSILAEFSGSQQGAEAQRGEASQRHADEVAALQAMPSISDAINREQAALESQRDAA